MTTFPLLALLAACDSPAPAMMGADATRMTVEGVDFTVRVRGSRVEAIRTNMMPNPSIGSVYPRAVQAMEEVSGCRVIEDSLRGDVAVMRADLDCG
ncbi:hypothetical protein [Nioella sediminis]|uniref:hypothetical protein n=1 Tax=Nioella sediminis TaxID=1912092 RepID=UPI000AA1D71C|nr:hypothetical protein [Nioella sediminis]